jgi:hypothetical protein
MLSLRGPTKIEMVWLMLNCVVIEPKSYAQSRIIKYEEKQLFFFILRRESKKWREKREREGEVIYECTRTAPAAHSQTRGKTNAANITANKMHGVPPGCFSLILSANLTTMAARIINNISIPSLIALI